MMNKKRERIIFDNYYSDERYNDAATFLLDEYGKEEGWKNIEDVPDEKIFEEMNFEEGYRWESFQEIFEAFFDKEMFLLRGTVGRWDGPADGGFIFSSLSELSKAWSDCDYIKIYDVNGHLYIQCSHHDGTNYYEVRQLTDKGVDYVYNHENYMYPRQLHDKLWDNHFLCKLPHCFDKRLKHEHAA